MHVGKCFFSYVKTHRETAYYKDFLKIVQIRKEKWCADVGDRCRWKCRLEIPFDKWVGCQIHSSHFNSRKVINKVRLEEGKWEERANQANCRSEDITDSGCFSFMLILENLTSIGSLSSNNEGESMRITALPIMAVTPKTHKNSLSSTMATMPQSWSSWK